MNGLTDILEFNPADEDQHGERRTISRQAANGELGGAMFIVVLIIQGRPRVISDDEGDPHVFSSMDDAMEFTTRPHFGVQSSESILILDCESGETEML